MITRRWFTGAGTALVGYGLFSRFASAQAETGSPGGLASDLIEIERESGGRLGVAVFDALTRTASGHRADERFPMCSTFKLLAAAAVLNRVDDGRERLDRRIRFEAADIVANSIITKNRVGGDGMSVEELCEAAMMFSDNTAGNLLLASLGGPSGLTNYIRSIGDRATRLDRIEPTLNEAIPGDPRDTTTPSAMLSNLHKLVLGTVLSDNSKDQLTKWLIGNKTGAKRLRAGLPSGWKVGDKTGSGERGSTNDVGVIWPPERAPIFLSIYLTETPAESEHRNATLAAVARLVASRLVR